jgi:hypothetical protein
VSLARKQIPQSRVEKKKIEYVQERKEGRKEATEKRDRESKRRS